MLRPSIAIMVVVLAMASAGCKRTGIPGSGVAATELRDVGDFDEIEFLGVGRLEVTVGQPKRLEMTADDNLLPVLRTVVQGSRLIIEPIEEIRPRVPIVIEATVPELRLISGAGFPEVVVEGLQNDTFSIAIKGNGKVVARGETGNLKISVTGYGDVQTTELVAEKVKVTIMGNGQVVTHAEKTLDVSITGAGTVLYRGEPEVHERIIGSGTIRKQ
jgi:hypothetical protein